MIKFSDIDVNYTLVFYGNKPMGMMYFDYDQGTWYYKDRFDVKSLSLQVVRLDVNKLTSEHMLKSLVKNNQLKITKMIDFLQLL